MYSQIDGIYFSHTAILSGPAFRQSPMSDTTKIDEVDECDCDHMTEDLFRSSMRSATRKKTQYDVFLGFRGEDTRNTFTCHLYNALMEAGINTFMDDQELSGGGTISNELDRAIKGSRISVIVLSSNYADSSWRLEELSKIMDCKRTLGQIVIPIFYGLTPAEVRKQTGKVAAALMRLETRLFMSDSNICNFESEQKQKQKLKQWKAALTEAATLTGWDSIIFR